MTLAIPSQATVVVLPHDSAVFRLLEQPNESCPDLRRNRETWCAQVPDLEAGAAFDLAASLDLPLLDLANFPIRRDAIQTLSAETARRLRALPVARTNSAVALAVDTADAQAMAALDFVSQLRVMLVLVTPTALRAGIAEHYDKVEDSDVARQLGIDPGSANSDANQQDIERLAREKPIVRLIHGALTQAVNRRASDIHFRPSADGMDLLYRIDDELIPVRRFLSSLAPALVSRIKVLGNMNLAEHRLPQDGRTSITLDDGRTIDLRISVMPTVHGESVALRVLDTADSLKTLDQIGLTGDDHNRIQALLARNNGMLLVTGPTGCGKSTTLYAMLLQMRQQHINILTIEDPAEFRIAGIQQMQVNRATGFTFARAMRNFLRHDPDAIMVGEIRDGETASIAVESALTGHLLLSTLHTNSAATAVTRLLDLGVEPYLLRASLAGVMAQRLVRLTCEHCREPETVPNYIRDIMQVAPDEMFFHGSGCVHCNGLGVSRRAAVYELMVVTPAIRRCITAHAEADQIHEVALQQGMVSVTQSALAMARSGRISLSEAYRVRND